MLTDALLDCYSLNSGSMLHASSPQREAALKELEASENGFRENLLLPWQDSPFQHSRVRIKLRGGLKHCEIVSPQADELSNRSYGFHFVVAFFFFFPSDKTRCETAAIHIWKQTACDVQTHPISSV